MNRMQPALIRGGPTDGQTLSVPVQGKYPPPWIDYQITHAGKKVSHLYLKVSGTPLVYEHVGIGIG